MTQKLTRPRENKSAIRIQEKKRFITRKLADVCAVNRCPYTLRAFNRVTINSLVTMKQLNPNFALVRPEPPWKRRSCKGTIGARASVLEIRMRSFFSRDALPSHDLLSRSEIAT